MAVADIKDLKENALADLVSEIERSDFEYKQPAGKGELGSQLKVHEIPEVIRHYTLEPRLHEHTLLLLGSSAIGKTYAIRQGLGEAAKAMGRELELHELHVSQMGPTDVMGVPRDDGNGRTLWFPPRLFPLESALPAHAQAYRDFLADYEATGQTRFDIMQGHKQYAIFLDELTNPSNPSIVHQCFPIIYGKFVADHKLVQDTVVIAAGNRVQDGTNSINLARSAVSRMDVIEVLPDLLGWMKHWAMKEVTIGDDLQTRVHPLVIAYLHRNSHAFAPIDDKLPPMEAYPSPRTWTYVSDLLYAHDRIPFNERQLKAQVAGRIGTRETELFWAFRQYWRDLPDVNKLLNSAEVRDGFGWLPREWPKSPDIQIIMVTQMVGKLTQDNAKRFLRFLMDETKFGPEYVMTGLKMLRPAGKLTPLASNWAPELFADIAIKYRSVFL